MRRPRALLLAVMALLPVGCSDSDGDDQSSGLTVVFEGGPSAPSSEAALLRLRKATGDILSLDVVGRDISAPLDGLSLAISFDPMVVEVIGVSDNTFLGKCSETRPDNTLVICVDNVVKSSPAANDTGVLIASAVTDVAPPPSPETISGTRRLATISFRARNPGRSSIYFHVPGNPAPGTGTISEVFSAVDPGGASRVRFRPDAPREAFIQVDGI